MAGIRLKDIHKTYQVDGRTFPVLNGVDLEIPEGKITVILVRAAAEKRLCCGSPAVWNPLTAVRFSGTAPTRPPLCSRNRGSCHGSMSGTILFSV